MVTDKRDVRRTRVIEQVGRCTDSWLIATFHFKSSTLPSPKAQPNSSQTKHHDRFTGSFSSPPITISVLITSEARPIQGLRNQTIWGLLEESCNCIRLGLAPRGIMSHQDRSHSQLHRSPDQIRHPSITSYCLPWCCNCSALLLAEMPATSAALE